MSLPEQLPGIALREAIERLGGRENLVLKQLRRFATEQTQAVANIQTQLSEANQKEAIRLAHSLKGLAANLGCNELSLRAMEVEKALKENLEPTLEALQQALNEVIDSIGSLPKAAVIPAATVQSMDLGDRLRSIQEGLKQRNFSVVAEFEKLEPLLREKLSNVPLDELSRAMRSYDLTSAAATLETLMRDLQSNRRD